MVFLELPHSWVAAGEDSITVAGTATQWLVDGGDDNDSIASPTQLSAQRVLGGSGATASTSALFLRVLFKLVLAMTPSKSLAMVLPVHHLKAGVGDDLMSITGGITDGSLFGGTGNDSFDFTGGKVTGVVDTGAGVTLWSWVHW